MTNNLTKILPNVNPEVTDFLDKKSNPFRIEIELLRKCILSVNENIAENIKWNAPNYV